MGLLSPQCLETTTVHRLRPPRTLRRRPWRARLQPALRRARTRRFTIDPSSSGCCCINVPITCLIPAMSVAPSSCTAPSTNIAASFTEGALGSHRPRYSTSNRSFAAASPELGQPLALGRKEFLTERGDRKVVEQPSVGIEGDRLDVFDCYHSQLFSNLFDRTDRAASSQNRNVRSYPGHIPNHLRAGSGAK